MTAPRDTFLGAGRLHPRSVEVAARVMRDAYQPDEGDDLEAVWEDAMRAALDAAYATDERLREASEALKVAAEDIRVLLRHLPNSVTRDARKAARRIDRARVKLTAEAPASPPGSKGRGGSAAPRGGRS